MGILQDMVFRLQKRPKVGFVVPELGNYYTVMPSVRLRALDIIRNLRKKGVYAEIYNPDHQYEIVIFVKSFAEKDYQLASELKNKGTIIVLDINVNYIEIYGDIDNYGTDEGGKPIKYVNDYQQAAMQKFIGQVDYIITSSEFLKQIYQKYHPHVICIEENISDEFFKVCKQHQPLPTINLVYCGFSKKASEIYLIKNVLIELKKHHSIKLLLITDEEIHLEIIEEEWIKYDQKKLPYLLLSGDIKIAPRRTDNSYNLGHSFTKVGYPMAVGLPVVASPVPSYFNRNVQICHTDQEWFNQLSLLIADHHCRNLLGMQGRALVKSLFSEQVIVRQYLNLFQYLTAQKM